MDTLVERIAKTCHTVNQIYCRSIGDHSQPDWEQAPEWQKASARDGVRFHMQNPGASAEMSHNNWWRAKSADGWVYGSVKDPLKKTHPCCLPFHQLPAEQRAKDELFIAVVRGFVG